MTGSARLLAFALGVLALAPAQAAGPQPFVSGSMQAIRAAHAGRPFLLGLWSLTCSHCQEELALLGRLKEQHPTLDLVLVSTDTPEDAEALSATLARHGLARAESWVFADQFTELLRQEVDPRWSGELPRTLLFDRGHGVTAHSGRLTATELEQWITRTQPAHAP